MMILWVRFANEYERDVHSAQAQKTGAARDSRSTGDDDDEAQ